MPHSSTNLQTPESQLKALLKNTEDYILICDSKGYPVVFNNAYAKIINKTLGVVMRPGLQPHKLLPDSREVAWWDNLHRRVLSGEKFRVEYKLPIDDELHYFEFSYHPIVENNNVIGFTEVTRDITQYKLRAQQLLESEELYSNILESMSEGVLTLNRFFQYTQWNRAMEEISGVSRENVINSKKTAWEIFPHLAQQGVDAMMRRAMAGELVSRDNIPFVTPKGKCGFTSEIYLPLKNSDGKVRGVIGVVRDVSQQKIDEENRRQLEIQLQHSQKLESIGLLAGGIAHDFNNLLMGILGNADIVLGKLPLDSTARQELEEIKTSSTRASELCRQMLAYAGKGKYIIESIELSQLVREMTDLLELTISKKTTVRYNLAKQLPIIRADSTQIRQVIMNLFTNAAEALESSNPGYIEVSTGIRECNRDFLQQTWLKDDLAEGKYVYFQLIDSGCGIPLKLQEKIFDPFYSTKFQGRGLGLAAVLGIVRGHHGAINLQSKPGQGTTVTVLFPAATRQEIAKSSNAKTGPTPIKYQGGNKILLVDDEPRVLLVTQKMLTRIGFTVLTATDGGEALKVFAQHHRELFCAIIDFSMPKMSGEQVFQKFQEIDTTVPVILSSGYGEQEMINRFGQQDFGGFIEKPYTIDALREKIKAITFEKREHFSR